MISATWLSVLEGAVLFFYVGALTAFARAFVLARREPTRSTLFSSWFAFGAHCLLLLAVALREGRAPVIGMANAMSFIAWSAMLCFIFLQSHLRSSSLGVFILALAVALTGISWALPTSQGGATALLESGSIPGWLLGLHMATALFSYSCFAIAFAGGLMYLLLDHELHGRHLGFFSERMPPLSVVDKINTHAIGLGITMLGIGVVLGAAGLALMEREPAAGADPWADNPKTATTVLIWLVYAVSLFMAVRGSWRGRRVAVASIFAFGLVVALYFIVNLMWVDLHGAL